MHMSRASCQREKRNFQIFYHSTLFADASLADHGKEFLIDQHCLFLRFLKDLFPGTCQRQMKGIFKLPIHFSSIAEQSNAEIIFLLSGSSTTFILQSSWLSPHLFICFAFKTLCGQTVHYDSLKHQKNKSKLLR